MKKELRTKYLFKNTIIFGLSALATKLIQFFLVPLYTKVLSPSDYGNIDLLFTICSFLYPLITLNISEAVYRFSLDKDKDDNKIFSIAFVCFIASVIFGILSIPILSLFNNYKNLAILFYIYLISLSLSQISLITLKGREKLKLFAIGNIINVSFIAIFNILFLIVLKLGVNGYFYGYILANIVTIIFALIYTNAIKNLKSFHFDKKLFIQMTKYSMVLMPTSFMWWIINSSDRVMVTSMVSAHANGLYAVSYKLPSMLTVIATIFNQAWTFSAISEKDSEDKKEFTNTIFKHFSTLIIIMAMFMIIVIKQFYHLYVSAEYYSSWKYMPLLLFGFAFMTLGTFISSSYNVHKDSKGFLFSGMLGAIVNIILNFALIPFFGVYGAAIATALSYISVFTYRIIDTSKYVKIEIKSEYIINVILLVLLLASIYVNGIYGLLLQLLLFIITVIYNKSVIMFYLTNIRKKLVKRK